MSFKFNFSANTGYLWKELPFLERLAMAKKYDFETVEFHDEPYKENIKWESVISTFGPGIPAVTVVPPRRVMS